MKSNPFAYVISGLFVLLAHCAMLANILYNGNYEQIGDVWSLAAAVLGLDLAWAILMPFFRQHTHTVDFILILILNMSLIFQSCFGGVHLSVKHMITCIAALIASRIGFLVCRDHNWIARQKKLIWIGIGLVMIVILLFTGSRSMWIDMGSFTIQPSELLKPLLVMACATSVAEQQKKHKLLWFNVVWENLILLGITAAICLLQWWCRDLGSIPTFAGIYAAGFFMRICYPKAKFSKKTLIGAGIAVLVIAGIGIKLAPAYVRDRLFVDIWSDKTGNGYQQSQALIAIADGGWFGKGPGKGFLHNVFAYESDIVFSTISEEWGLLFALMMIFILLLMLAVPLINPPRSYYHGTLAAGVCAAFTVQMALNIFGSCNMIPFTGVTIPFISMGGTSMVTSGLMAGMLIASQSPSFGKLPAKKKRPSARPAVRKGAGA
ncbi:MAG: FtsW/RodA/SpoVE family cell cycle protein [Ruminococcus sp.]|nr:FtsW/RodA/SpoVE family cell cycle protein [Ruminococcus sp.]